MECPATERRRRWAALSGLGGWLAIGAMLSIGCASGPCTFVALVENKTAQPREVRVVSQIDDRRVEVSADVPPGGSVSERSEWHASAQVGKVGEETSFKLTPQNASVEVWENPSGGVRRKSVYPGGRP
jgi:hypothetical protein